VNWGAGTCPRMLPVRDDCARNKTFSIGNY
jgi:hypothetical protein